jgi:hypothetical protein
MKKSMIFHYIMRPKSSRKTLKGNIIAQSIFMSNREKLIHNIFEDNNICKKHRRDVCAFWSYLKGGGA